MWAPTMRADEEHTRVRMWLLVAVLWAVLVSRCADSDHTSHAAGMLLVYQCRVEDIETDFS